MLDFIKLEFPQELFHILTLVGKYYILALLDLKPWEKVEFSHHTHLKLLTDQIGERLT